jgi:TetR/AcrR family transcriptional regulator
MNLTIQLVNAMKTVRHPAGTRNKPEAREAILAAAERLFARDGLAGARTDRIAAEAGVNKALLYYYFASKERLYEAVIEAHFKEFNGQALDLLAAPGRAGDILLRYVSMHFDFISARHRYAALFHQVMTAGGSAAERLVRKYIVPRNEAFGRLIERGMREGDFRRVDRYHTGISVIALIVFYFSAAPVLRCMGQTDAYSHANLELRKREVMDFVRHGLFANPQAP